MADERHELEFRRDGGDRLARALHLGHVEERAAAAPRDDVDDRERLLVKDVRGSESNCEQDSREM